MIQWVKVSAAKPDNLSLVKRNKDLTPQAVQ